MKNITLKTVALPDFGTSPAMPAIPAREYGNRINLTVDRMRERQLDVLLVFADREHSANFSFLCGLDPRFEEALLLLDKNGKRKLLFGNECFGALGDPPLSFEKELFQDFSLLGQDRSRSRPLEAVFRDFGIGKGLRIGCTYYKYYGNGPGNTDPLRLDIPAYMADLLRELTENRESVLNVNDLFMDASTGLRHHLCLEELVRFEWASTRTSESMKKMIREITPGKMEYELARNYRTDGLPLNCHPMLSTGSKARWGLSSPSENTVSAGDPFTAAFGVWGALTCRAGMVAEGPEQLETAVASYYEKFWRNYFSTVVAWYETVGIGVSAGKVFGNCEAARDASLFDFALNTGHSIHLDEWVNSPFYAGSEIRLHSGLALQMDIIPANMKAFVAANAEDGIVLADEALRNEWAQRFPESWQRIEQRRDFMIGTLGIQLKPEVLPLSNIPAYYAPYLLKGDRVAVVE